jgi:hypothetical protein
MEDFKSVTLLDDSFVEFDSSSKGDQNHTGWQTLENNWKLIRALATVFSQYQKRLVFSILGEPLNIPFVSGDEIVTSTGVGHPTYFQV